MKHKEEKKIRQRGWTFKTKYKVHRRTLAGRWMKEFIAGGRSVSTVPHKH